MGKTAAGAVWLDAAKTSPYDYYQYWINCDDRDVEKLLKIFTFLPLDEIARLAALSGAELRQAKQVLAFEATKITHGQAEAQAAVEAAQAAFGHQGDLDGLPSTVISQGRLAAGLGVLQIFVEVGLTQSRSEARRLVEQGGVYVNDVRVTDIEASLTPADLTADGIMLRAGKKKYHRLVVS
jgi:tyrosyl-tRNA synthetase